MWTFIYLGEIRESTKESGGTQGNIGEIRGTHQETTGEIRGTHQEITGEP
jgi:hypothetical protein